MRKKNNLILLGLSLVLLSITGLSCKDKTAFTPVTGFDLQRYLGTWYEIARMPFSFEKDLVGVTATYSLRPDGKVKVLNQGKILSLTGRLSTAVGKAKFAADPATAHIKVSFFGPFYADYIVVELDPEYRYALVISSLRYAWILSRTPELDPAITEKLIGKLKAYGLDTSRLIMPPQE